MLRDLSCLVILFMSSGVTSAQVAFEPRFTENTRYVTQSEQKTKQSFKSATKDLTSSTSSLSIVTTTVGKRAANGSLEVEERYDRLQTLLSFPGDIVLSFDSANADKAATLPQLEPMLDALRLTCRIPVTFEVGPANNVLRVKLPEGEFEKLSQAMKIRFKPEWIQKTIEQKCAFLPRKPVKPGESWELSVDAMLGDGQVMTCRTQFEYVGTTPREGVILDKFSGKIVDVIYGGNGNNSGMRIKGSELKVVESSGTFLFDRERGAVISRLSNSRIAGPLTIVTNGAELTGQMEMLFEENTVRQN